MNANDGFNHRTSSSTLTASRPMVLILTCSCARRLTLEGIGAADITKLKANGFFTIAVYILCPLRLS
ncbi:hypothetical protein BDV06DRAFT_183698 [Aspergillus oleicola]